MRSSSRCDDLRNDKSIDSTTWSPIHHTSAHWSCIFNTKICLRSILNPTQMWSVTKSRVGKKTSWFERFNRRRKNSAPKEGGRERETTLLKEQAKREIEKKRETTLLKEKQKMGMKGNLLKIWIAVIVVTWFVGLDETQSTCKTKDGNGSNDNVEGMSGCWRCVCRGLRHISILQLFGFILCTIDSSWSSSHHPRLKL